MKTFKKIMALVIATVMMAVPAMAAVPTSQEIAANNAADETTGKYTISKPADDTHTYTVYQILTGTLIAGENKLGNPQWGSDAAAPANTTANQWIESIKNLSGVALSEAVAAVLKSDASGTALGTSLDVDPGYYLIKDTTASLADGDAYSLNIVAVFNDIQITPKKGTTTSDKKVDDKNDSDTSEDTVVWQDTADYDLGDDVPFKLSTTIADDYANYTHGYKLTFHDTESAGLSFKANTVKVFVGDSEITEGFTVYENKEGTTLPEGMNWATGETFMVHFPNLKSIAGVAAGTVISVTYSSTLTGDAVVYGNDGNPNTSHVTYTNNPNDTQGGENGKTPDDKVVVFVYKLDINKVDPELKKLKGAEFTLKKKLADNSLSAAIGVVTLDDDKTQFEFKGLDDGVYVLTETKTPTGYNTIEPITFTISATHAQDPQELKLTALSATGLTKNNDGSDATTDGNVGTGTITSNVINNQGAELPSTGGMGTTIFYVIGAILVLGAGILLVSKRRMSAN